MFNFRFNVTDYINEIPSNILIIGIFFLIVVLLGLLAIYIFSSLGIMKAAQKNNIPNAWIAFVPYGRYYIIGKLGFEIYPDDSNKYPELTWILFGLSVASLFANSIYSWALALAITIFNAMAFYNIFKVLVPKNATMFTVFTIIVENLGGLFLYSLRDKIEKVEVKSKKETKKEKTKYCPYCGQEIK